MFLPYMVTWIKKKDIICVDLWVGRWKDLFLQENWKWNRKIIQIPSVEGSLEEEVFLFTLSIIRCKNLNICFILHNVYGKREAWLSNQFKQGVT